MSYAIIASFFQIGIGRENMIEDYNVGNRTLTSKVKVHASSQPTELLKFPTAIAFIISME